MKFREMIEGLEILAQYEEYGLDAHLEGAGHDVIWASEAEVDEDAPRGIDEDEEEIRVVDTRISAEDNERLRGLGWFVSGDVWTHYC